MISDGRMVQEEMSCEKKGTSLVCRGRGGAEEGTRAPVRRLQKRKHQYARDLFELPSKREIDGH